MNNKAETSTLRKGKGGPDDFSIGAILTFMIDENPGYFLRPGGKKPFDQQDIGERLFISRTAISRVKTRKQNLGDSSCTRGIDELSEKDLRASGGTAAKAFYRSLPYDRCIALRMVEFISPAVDGFSPGNERLAALLDKLNSLMKNDRVDGDDEYFTAVESCRWDNRSGEEIREKLQTVFAYAIRERTNDAESTRKTKAPKNRPQSDRFDLEVLRELCGYIPAASILGARDRIDLDRLYVSTRLCVPDKDAVRYIVPEKPVERRLEDILADDLPNRRRILLLGAPDSGKTLALKAIAMNRYQQKSRLSSGGYILSDNPTTMNNPVFLMNCGEFCGSYNSFSNYVSDSFTASSSLMNPGGYFDARSATESMLSRADKGLILLIDGLERINNINWRREFLQTLSDFMDNHPKVMAVLTSTPDVLCGSRTIVDCNDNILKAVPYMILPFDNGSISNYCTKWGRLFSSGSVDPDKIQNLAKQDVNIGKVLSSPLLLSYFLATVAPERNRVFTSELMLIGSMVDVATRSFLSSRGQTDDSGEANRKISKYNVKVPVGIIAMYMNLVGQRSLPLTRNDRTEDTRFLSVEELLGADAVLKALDIYLSDQSYIRCNDAIKFIDLIESYPFVTIERRRYKSGDDVTERRLISFSSSVFQNYFASYAIGKGCYTLGLDTDGINVRPIRRTGIEETVSFFLDGWCDNLCAASISGSDDLSSRSVKVIADAAVISRQLAGIYVNKLAKMSEDTSVSNRRRREFAVQCLLAILASEPTLTTDDWKLAVDCALRNCLYHSQLEYINRIIQFAPRRELFLSHIYSRFCASVRSGDAWPDFEWAIGHICCNRLNMSVQNAVHFGDECFASRFVSEVIANAHKTEPVNRIDDLRSMIRSNLSGTNVTRTEKLPYVLALVASFCSGIWYMARYTRVSEFIYSAADNAKDNPNEKIDDNTIALLCTLIGCSDQRISNQACFSLMHCRTMALKGDARMEGVTCDFDKLFDDCAMAAMVADCNGKSAEAYGGLALCGGLRFFTAFDINKSHYGRLPGHREDYNRRLQALGVMNSSGFIPNANVPDETRRKLMLLFKLCFLSAAWEDGSGAPDPANALPAMKQLVRFRYPDAAPEKILSEGPEEYRGVIRQIGLAYDREEEFFRNLSQLYRDICSGNALLSENSSQP